MSLWTSASLEAATGGRATRAFAVEGLTLDSRDVTPGDLFIALKDARDGHDFAASALRAGAAAALVSRIPEGCTEADPLLVVPDVMAALEALGRAGRARIKGRVIAVTGSVGKTSTKEMLRDILAGQGRVHAAVASLNNHWGVPLTLARMPADTEFAVLEIGMNHPGEIAPLARMARPHVALITTVAGAHMEAFGALEGIAEEKASIFQGLEPGGTAVVPEGLGVTPLLKARAEEHRLVSFGEAGDWRLRELRSGDSATVVQADTPEGPMLLKVASPGRHFALNALGALAAAVAAGVDPALAALNLARWSPPAGRGARHRVQLDPAEAEVYFELIDDAYNANPASMTAAFEVLAQASPRDGIGRIRKGRRIAILGDMLELGATEIEDHRALADLPTLAGVTHVHTVGPLMRALWQALPEGQRGEAHDSIATLLPRLRLLVDAGDVVLVKGSKGIKVAQAVDGLRKLGQSAAPDGREE